MTKRGCSSRALPERYGPWRKIYMRDRRCVDQGELERVFAELKRDEPEALLRQREPQRPFGVSIDSNAQVHQDGTGRQGNRAPGDRSLVMAR